MALSATHQEVCAVAGQTTSVVVEMGGIREVPGDVSDALTTQ